MLHPLPMSIPSPDVQPIHIWGPLNIQIYALCLVTGIIIAWFWVGKRLNARGAERGVSIDFTVWAVVMGIIGARIYHVLTHWGFYFAPGKQWWNPLQRDAIWNIWDGGIAIFGALIGGAVGVFIASRLTGIRFWSFADALVPGLLAAQAFGRVGNWVNHELFGTPTTLPWGLEIESTNPAFPIGLPEGTLFHPTFLYEILWNLLGIVVLLLIERGFKPRWGKFFGMYLIWYGIGRFFIEGMRLDTSFLFLGLRTNQLTALLAVLLGVAIILWQRRRHPGLETSIYLPGRVNPANAIDQLTADPEEFYHVFDARREAAAAERTQTEPEPATTN